MKSLFVVHIIKFVAFLFISMFFGCTKVDNIKQYNDLYEKYVSEKYVEFEHFEKQKKAKKYIYNHNYQSIFPKFDIITHRHILIVLCGRFVNLLRGNYNEEMPWAKLPYTINSLHYKHNWKSTDFIWAHSMSMNSRDPMINYAKKFLNSSSGEGISPKAQIINLTTIVDIGYDENIKQIARLCKGLEIIYNIMEPYPNLKSH
ncbi:hypothetical protein [Bartonella doshiae]|uniref:Lipoprotein n=2 Tax=Bartonella doshiae TaxID=33044 RepID=A0A380ZE66_BARDO|nr:hypothetical protein [Bartonella doshiae]EJF81783.1 hypothetical protein MCS_00208 [Bartonella doshiae NCTC 12862 = ATCC 700133]MBB6159779.1 hypothetical protein [Bartonella doshiae]SUV44790.1 Uncharacterised protein [Bartonella doshiae]